jgi:hypothetical protein
MFASLPRIGLAKADNPDSPFDGRKAQDVQPCIQISNGYETRLRVIIPVIRHDYDVRPLEISGAIKWQMPFGLIPGTLVRVEFNSHDLIVVTIRLAVNAQLSMGSSSIVLTKEVTDGGRSGCSPALSVSRQSCRSAV